MNMQDLLTPALPILLVDDEKPWLNSLSLTLRAAGINNIATCADSREVLAMLAKQPYLAMVLDLVMPHLTGDSLLPEIVQNYPEMPVVILTGLDQVESAVQAMQLGAFDYHAKVAGESRLIEAIRRAIHFGELRRENRALKHHFLRSGLEHPECFSHIITNDPGMQALFRYMEAIAATQEPILITGETGSGKELFAQAMHKLSQRGGQFVAVNIAGLDEQVFSDTLFGHRKGAFTGASQARPGLISQAANGTLFLDEIGDIEQSIQLKLLRLIQEREYFPIGSDLAQKTSSRMIFATLQEMETLRDSKRFRSDLYYRLCAHHIHVPPLRQRPDDLPLLLEHFLAEAAARQGIKKPAYPQELLNLLKTYSYPGNIRELRNIILDAVSVCEARTLSLEAFRRYLQPDRLYPLEPGLPATGGGNPFSRLAALPTLKEAGQLLVEEAMQRSHGNQALAAELLGVTRQALNWRLKRTQEHD